MRQLSYILLFTLLTLNKAKAQNYLPSETSTLQAKGVGQIKVAPDKAIISMNITSKSQNFNTSIQELNKKVSLLEKEIESAGFKKTDMKTTGYIVNKNIIYTNEGPVDSGYIGRQTFYIEFPNEQERIIKLVKTLSQSKVAVDFNFSFTLSDARRDETEKELIKQAYKDAEVKAKLIAETAGITLKRILSIQYSKPEIQPVPFSSNMIQKDQASDFQGFTVKELELSDDILITWEISDQAKK